METNKYKILIADPDKLFLEKLSGYLSSDDRIDIVGVINDPLSIYPALSRLQPDALLFEPAMPKYDLYKLIRELCVLFDKTITIALSQYNFPELVNSTIELGLQGFLWKETDLSQIYTAIDTIKNGHKYVSEATQTGTNKMKVPDDDDFVRGVLLSFRERDILTLLTRGYDIKKIARKFNTETTTISDDILMLMKKLSLKSIEQVKFFAIQQGLF